MSNFNTAEIKILLDQMGIAPKKSLGQNFLVNQATCEKLVKKAESGRPSAFVEVGPGLGALTHPLLKLCEATPERAARRLTVIELDRAFSELWREKDRALKAKDEKNFGVQVIEADALQMDWSAQEFPAGTCLVSNLPYQISSSLVIDRSVEVDAIQTMILMFQKEVAQRMVARPRTEDYGMLSVIAQTFWKIEMVVEVSAKDFYPPPAVASRVLYFSRSDSKWDEARRKKFLRFVKEAFAQRRKLLAANVSHSGESGLRARVESFLVQAGLTEKARAEELSIVQFQNLFESIFDGADVT